MKLVLNLFILLTHFSAVLSEVSANSPLSIPQGVKPPQGVDMSWDPNTTLPKITVIGDADEKRMRIYREARQNLVAFLSFWQQRGLREPASIKDLLFISNGGERTVVEILAEMNHVSPEEMKAQVKGQIAAFFDSEFYRALAVIGLKLTAIKEEDLRSYKTSFLTSIFDRYAFMRWGLNIHNMIQAIELDETYEVAQEDADGGFTDNAFLASLPIVENLQAVLKPQTSTDFSTLFDSAMDDPKNWYKVFFHDGFEDFIEASPEALRKQIVILPRHGEILSDYDMATAMDKSVLEHEKSHNLESLPHGQANRMISELFADMGTAIKQGCPDIGESFATASGKCAIRIEDQIAEKKKQLSDKGSYDPALELEIYTLEQKEKAFSKLAKTGHLRTMDNKESISTQSRYLLSNGAYDEGNLLRRFIWNIYTFASENAEIDLPTVEQMLFLRLSQELNYLPSLISQRSKFALSMATLRRSVASIARLVQHSSKLENEEKLRLASLLEQDLVDTKVIEEMKKAKTAKSESTKGQTDEEKNKKKQETIILPKAATDLINKKAANLEKEEQNAKEAKRNASRNWKDTLTPWSLRKPGIEVDYVSQSVISAIYRIARNEPQYFHPALVAKIKESAETVFERKVETVTLDNGIEEIFFRDGKEIILNWNGFKNDVKKSFEIMEENKRIYHYYYLPSKELEDEDRLPAMGSGDLLTRKEITEVLKEAKDLYEDHLEKIQELGRIGFKKRFYNPRPGLEFMEKVGKAFAKGFMKSLEENNADSLDTEDEDALLE